MRNLIVVGVMLLTGCAGFGGYRNPGNSSQCVGNKVTKGNCGDYHDTSVREGGSCSSDYNCALGQFCRKVNYSMTGVCVNKSY